MEDDGKVRLGIVPGQECNVSFYDRKEPNNLKWILDKRDSLLKIHVDMKQGSHVDILLPMLPTDKAIVDKEAAL